ncbi:MAG: Fe-S cluster assembly protein SufD [Terrimesophilobacter sp.]
MSAVIDTDRSSTVKGQSAAAEDYSKIRSKQHSEGGWGLVPIQARAGRFTSVDVNDFEPVSAQDIEWKYTPLAKVRPLATDALDGSEYEYVSTSSAGAHVEWVDRTDPRIGLAGTPEERASANAWSNFDHALIVTVSGDDAAEATITRSAMGAAARAAHTVVIAKKHSHGLVILQNSGPANLTENVEFVIEDDANLTVVTVQEWDNGSIHLASHFSEVGRGAKFRHIVVTLGGSLVRVNPTAHLAKEGGEVELFGVYYADSSQHLEHQVFVNHDAPHTKSRVSYKGALQGAGARTVWVGDVLIRPTASSADSYEENRNLLLTDGARADSVPNLEIETGDILGAGHASASGRFDDEQLFYLESRGIPEEDARRLVVQGFLFGILQKIGNPQLQSRLESVIETELRSIGVA